MVLTLVLAEAALQLVPRQIQSHQQIKRYAERRQKNSNEVLLDRAFHHAAMRTLTKRGYPFPAEKMGRPDIIHNTLLQVLETPLNWEGRLQTYVHTQDGYLIRINPKVRLPKNYVRFVGLIEQLFAQRKVPVEGEPLLELEKVTLQKLVRAVAPSTIVGFSTLGTPSLMRDLAGRVGRFENPLALVGGFPRGHFTKETSRLVDEMACVDREHLDAWVVAGRFVYDFEWAIGLAQDRVKLN